MHLFLSPHLDDAVLSCGGLIHQCRARGEAVRVVTFMTGNPPPDLPPTPLIADLHARWGVGENPVIARRAEDEGALSSLGAAYEHVGWLDAPYRCDADGQPLYPDVAALFSTPKPHDPLQGATFAVPPETRHVYAPLSAGDHVDHQLICRLAWTCWTQAGQTWSLAFYEDYPYASEGGEALRHSESTAIQPYGTGAVAKAQARIDAKLTPRLAPLDETAFHAKIGAIACYASQLSTFFNDADDLRARLWHYARAVQATPWGAERLWYPEEGQR